MKHIKILAWVGIVLCLLTACNPAQTKPSQASEMGEPGPYVVGQRKYTFIDSARNNREVKISVWYPAVRSDDSASNTFIRDAKPDLQEAPYPLILSSTKVADIFAPYLVSHGFAWASVDGIDSYMAFYKGAIDQPLDIVFALNQIGGNPPEELDGLIDAENAGTIGYSFDGFNSLAMSGARVDPDYYLTQCPTPDATTEAILGELSAFSCTPANKWDDITAYAGKAITVSEDGLWQPLTDPRIRAVMPMAGEGWWLFGERGLAAVDRPILIIVATEDELYAENVLIFNHLGVADKRMISFIGSNHMMVYDSAKVSRMSFFALAFFGYYLQGRSDLAQFMSEDYVIQHDDLAWGEYIVK